MKVQEWEVRRARFSLKEENVYILQGDWPSGYELLVFLDKEKIPARREAWEYESDWSKSKTPYEELWEAQGG